MGALQTDTAVRPGEGGSLAATLSRDWEIWGPNGGYIAAIALRAAGAVVPAGHRPASFSCQYLAVGAFEDVELTAEPVRRGRTAWCVNVGMRQGGKLLLQAQVWTTDRMEGPERAEARRPDVPGPAGLKTMEELRPPGTPPFKFWENFDAKPVRQRNGGWDRNPEGAVARGWYRYRGFEGGGDPFLEHARGLLLLDTLFWPTHARALEERPSYIAPSLELSAWFHAPAAGAEWLLLDTHTDTAGAGLIYGGGRVWSEDGRLLATGGQNMLVAPARASS